MCDDVNSVCTKRYYFMDTIKLTLLFLGNTGSDFFHGQHQFCVYVTNGIVISVMSMIYMVTRNVTPVFMCLR